MKKFIICLSLSFLGTVCYSQVNFGIKSGMNIATTKGLYAFPKNRIGWYGGGFVQIPLKRKLFLQPELLYSSKGNGFTESDPGASSVLRFNYLNIPLQLGYKIDQKTSFFFRPELGLLMSVQKTYGGNENYDVSKGYPSKFDVGINMGLNYTIIKSIDIGVRYNYGLKTLYSVDAVGNRHTEKKGAHRVFQAGLNYHL